MQNFFYDELSFLESPRLHFRVKISSCMLLVNHDSKLRVTSFLFGEIELASLQDLVLLWVVILSS